MKFLKKITLTHWILISMVVGVAAGVLFPEQCQSLKVLSNIFLRLIKCVLVPLVFGTLVVGIASHSDDMKSVGRLAAKSMIYFEIITTLALFIGLAAVNLFQPGLGVTLPPPNPGAVAAPAAQITLSSVLEHAIPKSFFEAAASNDVLQIVCFAVLFAVSLSQVPAKHRAPMLAFCESLTEIMFKFIGIVMKFAPFGIGAAMAFDRQARQAQKHPAIMGTRVQPTLQHPEGTAGQ